MFWSEIDCEWLNGLTDVWRFLASILQDKTFIWSDIIAANNSVSSNLKGSYGFVSSHLRFHTQSAPTRFPYLGISDVQ